MKAGKKIKVYTGEIGRLYQVKYLPDYMESWPDWKIRLGCWIFNRFPKLEILATPKKGKR